MSAGFVNEVVNIQQDQSYYTSSTTQQQTLFSARTLIINKTLTLGSCFIKTLFSGLHKQMFQKISDCCSTNSIVGKGRKKEIGT